MPGRPYILAETNWKTVADTAYQVAVLPWGATEAHNYHLPYATDVMECDAVAAGSARVAWERGAKVIVLPTVPFGVNTGQLDIKLCLNMNPSTQALLLRDLVNALEVQGILKLVVINGHGGNDFRQMIRELQPRTRVFLCTLNWYTCVNPAPYFNEPGDHAGELETSVMQHIAPDLVLPLSEAGNGSQKRPSIAGMRDGWVWSPRPWTKVSADTGTGNPAASSAAKGSNFLDAVNEKIGSFLVDLAVSDTDKLYG
ncbi:MAG: creatininase family protein [Gemmatimonadaceae bacterium]